MLLHLVSRLAGPGEALHQELEGVVVLMVREYQAQGGKCASMHVALLRVGLTLWHVWTQDVHCTSMVATVDHA